MTGGIIQGVDTSDRRLLYDTLFDKIINIRFIRCDPNGENLTTFTLRSDYEIVTRQEGNQTFYHFEKCRQKPTIRVKYVQNTSNVFTQVQVYITNLHFFMNDKADSGAFSANQQPIRYLEVQLGYFNQFPRFDDESLPPFNPAAKLEQYLNLQNANEVVKTLKLYVLGVYPVKLPPDGITLFDCKIGTTNTAFHSLQTKNDTPMQFKAGTSLERFLFQTITKRFPREFVPNKTLSFDSGDNGSGTGPMTDKCADEYGVKCFLSNGAKAKKFDKLAPAVQQEMNVEAAIMQITKSYFPDLCYARLYDGNYLFFLGDENITDVLNSTGVKTLNDDSIQIPAIKSISYGGTRAIVCPYFGLFHPFQELEFFARYNLANLIGYFYSPANGVDVFHAINLTVDFSTTGPENTMELTCVDNQADAKTGDAK